MADKLSTEDLTGRASTKDATPEADLTPEDARGTVRAPVVGDDSPARDRLRDEEGAGEEPRDVRGGAKDTAAEPLLAGGDAQGYETRWQEIQVGFVDEPREAVEKADNLVAELMRQLAETFADERRRLEEAWSAGEDVDTEDLRVALTRYRSFFHRLLAT
jgi:hypothetical protein